MKQEIRKFWIVFFGIHFVGIAGNILLYHFGLPNSIDSILESFRKQEYYLLCIYFLCYGCFCFYYGNILLLKNQNIRSKDG